MGYLAVMHAYRDGREGILRHIEDADRAIGERTSRITPALLRLAPDELRHRLEDLSRVTFSGDASLSDLQHVSDARAEQLHALDELIDLAPFAASGLRKPDVDEPIPPSQDDMWGPIGTERAIVEHREAASALAHLVADDFTLSSAGARVTVHMNCKGVPILWVNELGHGVQLERTLEPELHFLSSTHTLSCSVSTELPPLKIRPESMADPLWKLLRFEKDTEVGDAEFDKLFFVSADPDFMPLLLTPNVRRCMKQRASVGPFTLEIASGVAKVRFSCGRYVVTQAPVHGAARVLVRLRKALETFSLLRDE